MKEFVDAIRTQDPIIIYAAAVGIAISLIGLVLRLFQVFPTLRHPRNVYALVVTILLVLLSVILWISRLSTEVLAGLIALLFLAATPSFLLSLKIPLPFEKRAIESLARLVRGGNYALANRRITQKPFYLVTIPAKLQWGFLHAQLCSNQDKFKEAYRQYDNLASLPLFQDEKADIGVRRALLLYLMGDTLHSRTEFEGIKDTITKDADRYHLQGLLDEREGNLKLARENLLKAVAAAEKDEQQLGKVYNNLGRMEVILDNRVDAIHYYRKAATLAKKLEEKEILHIAFPNLIDNLLLDGNTAKARSILEEYAGLIDRTNVYDLLKLNNYYLGFARQAKDQALLLQALETGRVQIIPKLSLSETLAFEASELRIRWNEKIEWQKALSLAETRINDYFRLDFPEQYCALKEIFLVLKELYKCNQLGQFGRMLERLVRYRQEVDAAIEAYLQKLPDYCIFERCNWEKERAELLRFNPISTEAQYLSLLKQIIRHLENIKDTQLQHRNPLKAIEADLAIADEIMAQVTQTGSTAVENEFKPVAAQYTFAAVEAVQRFGDHPQTWEYNLRIARYALFLGEKELARRFFRAFKDAGVSIQHYADWLRVYYEQLEIALGTE